MKEGLQSMQLAQLDGEASPRIKSLQQKHLRLDQQLQEVSSALAADPLEVKRLKRKKLLAKDLLALLGASPVAVE